MSRFWRVLMGCVLEELLLAFIQVKKCSQEGREQMAMDTTRLYNYATSLCDIQPADDAKDLKYVLDYVTCCKLDEPADVMAWIEKHHAEYGQDVIDSIVNYAMAKKLNKQNIDEVFEVVARHLPRTHAPVAPLATDAVVTPKAPEAEKKGCCKN